MVREHEIATTPTRRIRNLHITAFASLALSLIKDTKDTVKSTQTQRNEPLNLLQVFVEVSLTANSRRAFASAGNPSDFWGNYIYIAMSRTSETLNSQQNLIRNGS
jgi:hypothetical protein